MMPTALLSPTYPTMPHMASVPFSTSCEASSHVESRPPLLDAPRRAAHGERAGRDVLGDRRAPADVRALADDERRHERRVGADEGAVADPRLVLGPAVVVAGDRAGADVDVLAHGRVAEVREVVRLGAAPDPRLLRLHEVADLRLLPDVAPGPQVTEGPERRIVLHHRLADDAVRLERDAVAEAARADLAAGGDHALAADRRGALEDDVRVERRGGADLHP